MSKLNGINLNGLQVSDLFFNSELENYNSVDRTQNNVEVLEWQALIEDAKKFSDLIGNQISPQELAEDFMKRV